MLSSDLPGELWALEAFLGEGPLQLGPESLAPVGIGKASLVV